MKTVMGNDCTNMFDYTSLVLFSPYFFGLAYLSSAVILGSLFFTTESMGAQLYGAAGFLLIGGCSHWCRNDLLKLKKTLDDIRSLRKDYYGLEEEDILGDIAAATEVKSDDKST